MLHLCRIAFVIAVAASISLVQLAEAAPTDAEKCEAAKVKEAGKYKFCRTKAISKGIKKAEAPDFTKCDEKYDLKWDKWELKWGAECPTLGDKGAIQAQCIGCVDDLAAALEPPKTVFLSSTQQNGNLGGLAGADALCNQLAVNAGLSGTYKAWLSDSLGTNPSTTFNQSVSPYVRVDGALVANDWADLIDGTLTNPICIDELGGDHCDPFGFGLDQTAFTNTRADGTTTNLGNPVFTCQEWTSGSAADAGHGGHAWETNSQWTIGPGLGCQAEFGLYCFEQ